MYVAVYMVSSFTCILYNTANLYANFRISNGFILLFFAAIDFDSFLNIKLA